MEALCDGGGIDEEATAQTTADVWVELVERELGLWERERERCKHLNTINHNVYWLHYTLRLKVGPSFQGDLMTCLFINYTLPLKSLGSLRNVLMNQDQLKNVKR